MVLVENNNDEVLSQMNLYVIFYDGDNNPIEVKTENITILEKKEKIIWQYTTLQKNVKHISFY